MKTVLLSALALMGCSLAFAQGEGSAPEQYPGYRLVFHDEFDRNGRPNPDFWTYEHGYVRNREAQFYREENAWCEDGCLVIEARKDDAGYPYTSASVISRGDTLAQPPTAWTYGRLEVRAKIPTAMGCWPAIWTVGMVAGWPQSGEIDVMEFYHIKGEPSILANVAWGTERRYVAKWHSRHYPLSRFEAQTPAWRDSFHVWRMDWDREWIRLYLDGELLNETAVASTVSPFGRGWPYENRSPFEGFPQRLLLNLALGGDNGGPLEATPFPCRYLIDYVRVWQAAGER